MCSSDLLRDEIFSRYNELYGTLLDEGLSEYGMALAYPLGKICEYKYVTNASHALYVLGRRSGFDCHYSLQKSMLRQNLSYTRELFLTHQIGDPEKMASDLELARNSLLPNVKRGTQA